MSRSLFVRIREFAKKRPLAFGAIAGLAAMILAGSYLKRREAQILFIADPLPVVVMKADVPEGAEITEDAVVVQDVPRLYVQPGALRSVKEAVGLVAMVPVKRGSQLTYSCVVEPGRKSGIAFAIQKGMRAVTVAVDDVTGVAGLVRPGNKVDVIGTFDFGDDAVSRKSTTSVMQNALVLAVGTELRGEAPAPSRSQKGLFQPLTPSSMGGKTLSTVTLAASPSEAQAIVFAQESGALTLLARSATDDEIAPQSPATIETLIGASGLLRQKKPTYREYKGK